MEASERTTSPPYFAFRTLTNVLEQMEEHGPPNRIDRSFLTGMSGAGQTQFIHGLKSLELIDENGAVQPMLTELATKPDDRPRLVGQLVRRRYPEAVDLGSGNATTGQLVDLFRDSYGIQGDTARKAIAFYLAAARFAGDIPLSPNFKTPTIRAGTSARKRGRPRSPDGSQTGAEKESPLGTDVPTGLHPALSGLLGDIPKRGETWTQDEHDNFMAAFQAIIKIAAPISDHSNDNDDDTLAP